MSKTLRKMMCTVLSAALCFSNLNITAISADTVLGSSITSEDSMFSDGSGESGTDQIPEEGSDAFISDDPEEEQAAPAFGDQTENAVYESVNRIHETDQVGVELTGWWYKNPQGEKQKIETTSPSEEDKTAIVCDLSQIEEDSFSEAGFDLSFTFLKEARERTVQASDYLSFTLPACLRNLTVTGADEDYYTYSLEEQEDHSCKMTVTFREIPETVNLTGTIHMAFSLQETMENEAGSTCLIVLQENQEKPEANISYEVIFPGKPEEEAVSEGVESAEEDSVKDAAAEPMMPDVAAAQASGTETDPDTGTSQVVTGKFRVSGTITFDEILDGRDWRSLVRPTEFDQPIEIVQTYKDENGKEQTITYRAQDDLSQNDFYLKFSHDGEGGGDFTIENVPKSVTVGEKEYQVTGYSINVAPSLEYYESTNPLTISEQDIPKGVASVGTLKLSLKSQILTLKPTVVPPDGTDNPSFVMNATFTNPKAENITAEGGKLVIPCRPSKNQSSAIQVPLGIFYAVTQTSTEGYKFDGNYTTNITGQESTTASEAEGTISQEKDVTIITVNYARNVFVGFDVNWIDNNRATRPTLSADNFVLQYKTEQGEWTDLTSDKMTELGIEAMPEFDASQALSSRYSFTGLPAVDAEDQKLSYQVIVKTAPEGYVSDYSDTEGRRTFTFQEQTDFSAQILWNDISDSSKRPEQIDSLSLYRRVDNGNYELVYENLPENAVSKAGKVWKVSLSGLPRYNHQNQEYDYVLVQGTIGENNQVNQESVDSYKTYYNNGSGSFGNDIALCHNNGKITEVLYDKVDFQAHKVWKDPADTQADDRPTSTVTLWRYVEGTKTDSGEEITDLDKAYESGKAAQVVFQTGSGETVGEDIVSYVLKKDTNETISFTASTVSGLSESYQFPAYDDQGRKYVYFVREALSGTNADHYEIKYQDADQTPHENGTLTGGTITNIRREKAAVAITKIWQNPAGLADIAGSQVQMKILASADEGETYDELTVYSEVPRSYDELKDEEKSAAQTASGFTASIPSGEVTYYVNTYNPEGQPYDMGTARIQEIVTKNGVSYQVTKDADGNEILVMGENTYKLASKYIDQVLMGDGTRQYRYKQTNTITASREYTLLKTWDASIPSTEYADITSVNFKLERRTTKDPSDGTPAQYETVEGNWSIPRDNVQTAAGGNVTWKNVLTGLPRYDEEGYEYYYRATEVSFTKKDGNIISTEEAFRQSQWTAVHHRTPDQTLAYNYKSGTSGRGYFTVSKLWTDNGDVENRKNIKVRIYYRPTLLQEVQKQQGDQKSDSDVADLEKLGQYAESTITNFNQYTTEIYYDTLYEGTGTKDLGDSVKNNWRNYVVLEYCVGDSENDGAQPAQYTYGQLKAAAAEYAGDSYHLSGTVENCNRMYRTNTFVDPENPNGHVLITNTRTGTTDVTVQKTWNDDSDSGGHRPVSLQFQMYQDGEEYKNIPDTVTITATGAVLDHDTGIVTVTGGTDNTWSFTLNGLPMFSTSALPHSYNVDEVAQESTGTQQFRYIQKKADTEVTGNEKHQNFSFSFSNTITGTVSHEAYKYWQDPGTEIGSRPDLYLTLYRYLKKDQKDHPDTAIDQLSSYTKYTDYKDQIWKAGPGDTSNGDRETGYNWKITIDDLPGYDEDGHEYAYVFREAMNNDGQTVQGTYVQSSETKKFPEGTEGTDYDTYEVFTNTIHDYMTVRGFKTWTGLAGYQIKTDELPDPLISLYRTIDPEIKDVQSLTDDKVEALLEQEKITLVDTARLTDNRTKYFFPDRENVTEEEKKNGLICMADGVAMLPKFNDVGKRYTYLIRETIEDPIASQLYTKANTNGTLANVFRKDVNRRSITVTKTWSGRDNLPNTEDKYPSVTYTLYRYEAGNEKDSTVKIETYKIPSGEFAEKQGKAKYTFQDLLIYSPTGVQYCYYIEENAIDGYSISYTDEPGITEETLTGKEIVTGPNSKITITEEMLKNLGSNHRIDIISLPEKWKDAKAAEAETNVSAGTTNTYDQKGKINISGEKDWKDYGNSEGLRPSVIQVTLTRHTNDETGQSNKVESTEIQLDAKEQEDKNITTPYIVWKKGENSQTSYKWQYTIYNLERYAPNGMPYIYTLSEEKVTGYQQAEPVEKQADQTGTISMPAMTNRFEGSYYVRKNWMDGNNKYDLRPASITVKLQRSTDGSKTWKDIPWPEGAGTYEEATGKWTGLPTVMSENDEKIVSINLTSKYEKPNTKHNSWEYTFTNLPTQDKDGNAYTYRCVETAIGGVPIKESTIEESSEKKLSAGAYECKYTTQDEKKTVIENTLDATSLVVTKQWKGDQDNLYNSRPESLTFVLQKRGIKVANENNTGEDVTVTPAPSPGATEVPTPSPSETETPAPSPEATVTPSLEESPLSDWETVRKANGEPYTFTISAADNWTRTLEDLPVATVVVEKGKDGQETSYTLYSLYFRAVEVHVDDQGNVPGIKPDGAQNYKDITDYSTGSSEHPNQDHSYDKNANHNVSNITNRLILDDPAKSIRVTKTWQRVSGASVEATLELQYKTNEESSWHSYQPPVLKKVSSTVSGSQTVEWTDLPKYDRTGKELVYQVVEHPIQGYKTEIVTNGNSVTPYATEYTFTNIELQTYTVKKIWRNTDYAEKTDNGFTATFQLQQQVGTHDAWTDVEGCRPVTLTSEAANDAAQEYTWKDLPEYTVDGQEISYRAVETQINGKNVTNNTNGSYMVSYAYDGTKTQPSFKGTETTATNRMIYGFVNLSKKAAYLAPNVTENNGKLQGVKFNIYQGNGLTGEDTEPYVSDVETDENGNLINTNGRYGTEQKYLISGIYTLKEASTNPDYSVWANGVTFTVGIGNTDLATVTLQDTGEHGTAWICTTGIGSVTLGLKVEYKNENTSKNHSIGDSCPVYSSAEAAVNLESRGVLSFTKTGPLSGSTYELLDTHGNAAGESSAYFGVYLDKECETQVAGMVPKSTVLNRPADKTTMILTDKAQDGTTTLEEKKDASGVPYLRAYTNPSYPQYPFTLLTGTYYIKELVAPAGYKLDTNIRKAVVKKIDSTAIGEDLSGVYPGNKAQIMLGSETDGRNDYKWSNTPNVVTLYKRDQYGRPVTLKGGGYLELKVEGKNNTFPSGENVIRLYQNTTTPATKIDGTEGITGYVSYDATKGAWTITGLFDINKTYTLSEPDASVPDENIKANSISFQMEADGRIVVTSSANETESQADPLAVVGNDYNNYYKPDAENNVMVMRDVSRYLKDVALEKKDSDTNKAIPNISFELYKYDRKDETTGELINAQSVLENNVYLTTNNKGKIVLSEQDASIQNQITRCALRYGLDVGKYYFKEVERGASDKYRLVDDIFFEIKPTTNPGTATDYSDYAKVTFDITSNSHVSQNPEDGKTGTVTNDPVTNSPKTLMLTKVDSADSNQKLGGARFTLSYTSVTYGQEGSVNTNLVYCITNDNGELYLSAGENGAITGNKPDISRKGSYVLKETQAPDAYMTRTEDGTVVTMVTFDVNSSNQIENVQRYNGAGELVTSQISSDTNGEHVRLDLTVKNEKTIVSVAKRNDIETNDTKTDTKTCDQKSLNGEPLIGATLQIYEGTDTTATGKLKVTLNGNSTWTWTLEAGILKENTIYTLHESQTPVGYLTADDIYFKLFGTTTKNGKVISQLYVWTGSGKPSSVDGDGWSKSTNLSSDNVLTMVDETIIAPVDLQKVLANYDNTSLTAVEKVEFTVQAGTTTLGTAITNKNGYLVWESITTNGYHSGLIYDADGHIVTSGGTNTGIILRQNESGYVFTETYAPDPVYNDGRSYHVVITEDNYNQYRITSKTETLYQTEKYVNLVEAEEAENHQVSELSTRGTETTYKGEGSNVTGSLAVNFPYKSTVTLHKYDGDEEGQKAAIPGTEFTLYRGSVAEGNVYQKAYSGGTENTSGVFTTNAKGELSIEIHEKGTYIVKETKAAAGYQLDSDKNTFTFTLVDTEDNTQIAGGTYGYGQINALKKDDVGVPNDRLKGEVILTKKDGKTQEPQEPQEPLDGVVYTLTRTNTPEDANNSALTEYLLKQPVDVTTGKHYTAVKSESGWTLTESAGESGKITITGLNWGSYTLTEKTELPGYKLELDAAGKAVNTYSFTVDGKTNALKFTDTDTNTKNSVTFYKTNQIDAEADVEEGGIKPLAGAVFEVHEGDGASCSETCTKASFYASDTARKDETVTSVTTGADGKVTIYGLATDTTGNTPKTYHLVETTAPKGYKLQTKPTVFTIDRQGKVQMKNAEGTYADADQVTMQDEPIKLYIQKLGEDDSIKLSGAEFELTDTCTDQTCDHKLANGAASETISVTATDGKVMIPIERVIGGHTYQLKETKAPDGYECTAVVTFTVKTDGTIETLSSIGGYQGTDGTSSCAALDNGGKTILIKDEKIRMSLTKVDYTDGTTPLAGVKFTLKPMEGSSFASGYNNTGLTYDEPTNTYTFTTDTSGKISFPEGLLKHDNSYLLKETATIDNYYLGKEARDGVILKVGKDGGITIERLDAYNGKTIGTASSCPVTVSETGNSDLISRNMKSTSFDLTKLVEGNMGDLKGEFQIKMEVFEPDGTAIDTKVVKLKLNDKYDSVSGFNNLNGFGKDAIPIGATLVITEDNELDYAAIVRITSASGSATEIPTENKGTAKVTLNTPTKVLIELVNTKDVAIDVGVNTENQAPWAALSLILPAIWLAYRYRRKRKGGEG